MTDLGLLEKAATAPSEAALGLPFSSYRSAEVFDAEMAAWRTDWIAVCSSAQVSEPGAAVPVTIGGEPVLVARSADGELRALSNSCSHRGTLLIDEPTSLKRIRCPYHAWTYSDAGELLAVPFDTDDRIDKAAHCLPRFQVGEWQGVVFVCLDATAEPLAERVAGIDEWLAPYLPQRYCHAPPVDGTVETGETWAANWKFVLENAMESYHLFRVHPKTLEPYSPTKGAFSLAGSGRWTVTAGATSRSYGQPDPALGDFARSNYTLVSLPPSLVGVITADSWGWLIAEPLSPEATYVKGGSLSAEPMGKRTAAQADAVTAAFLAEDKWICERNQRGIAARHQDAGRLVAMERVVGDFHQWIGWKLFGRDPEPAWRLAEPAA